MQRTQFPRRSWPKQGDAGWNICKEILGHLLNGHNHTIQLPLAQAEALLKELKNILKKKRIPLKRLRSIAGHLQDAAQTLPVARAFFTSINNALRGLPAFMGLTCNGEIFLALLDIRGLI